MGVLVANQLPLRSTVPSPCESSVSMDRGSNERSASELGVVVSSAVPLATPGAHKTATQLNRTPETLRPSKDAVAKMPMYERLSRRQIHVVRGPEMFAFVEREIAEIGVIGFDTETKPVFTPTQKTNGPHLIQIATLEQAFLFQTFRFATLPLLKEILESPYLEKVGFGLSQDRAALSQKLGIRLQTFRDVSAAFGSLGYRQKVGVKAAVAIVLGQQLEKSKKATRSNWSLPTLSGAQLHYAADDAHAALAVYLSLGCPSPLHRLQPHTAASALQRAG